MQANIKRYLDASVPEHITLTEAQMHKISIEAQRRMARKNPSRHRILKPLMIGAAVIGLSGLLSAPYLQNWSEERAFQQRAAHESPKEVTIEGGEYPSLINAIYENQTNEMIYTDHEAIYSYSLDSKMKRQLVEAKENAQIFNLAANENWLVWEEISTTTLYVLNRKSHEIKEFHNTHADDLQIEGDYLTYMSFGNEEGFGSYKMMDLTSFKVTMVHKLIGEGANSKASLNDGVLVIPERFATNGKVRVTFFLYDLKKQVQIGKYIVPYELASNVTRTNNKVFAQLTNEGEASRLAYIDLEDGKLYEVDVPAFEAYAVYGNYVALSVPKKDSNTVELYKIVNNKAVPLPTFNTIKERLVKPRFTDEGILVVNGEGKKLSMYVKDVRKIE